MKKLFYIGALSALLLAACGDEEDAAPKEDTPVQETEETTALTVDEKELQNYASNITGGTFLKSVALTDNYSVIDFYSTYEEYKQDNQESLITEEDYKGYFDTSESIEKILVIENVRLLRQFPGLAGAKMTLPFEGKTYSINLDRKSLNDYLGFKVEDLKTEDDSWTTKFVNPIGYDEQKRKELMEKFGTVN
ncbi:hypothetical protein [Lysinibacillus odysseyi]|uniref:hypothetical protein n=1 Tax=Lysinibacillus odysseyi TaxID=202611 RepID=UPI00068A6BB3|nr:hypothetical protein [Lysinibacillus odysseyi]